MQSMINQQDYIKGRDTKVSRGEKITDKRSRNDQRSDAKNPTSSEYKAANDNRSNQKNPNNTAYDGDDEDDEE
jgi:hypothetical protein